MFPCSTFQSAEYASHDARLLYVYTLITREAMPIQVLSSQQGQPNLPLSGLSIYYAGAVSVVQVSK